MVPLIHGWLDCVNLVAGTSAGGLLALGIAYGIDPTTIQHLLEEKANWIVNGSWLDDLSNPGTLTESGDEADAFQGKLKKIFGTATLSDAGKHVLIPSFEWDGKGFWKPKLFNNFPGPDSDGDAFAYKVGAYVSAAPTLFLSAEGDIDSGVFSANPNICAIGQAQYHKQCSVEEMALLSFETRCISIIGGAGKKFRLGYLESEAWTEPCIDGVLEEFAEIANFQSNQILGSRYQRLAPGSAAVMEFQADGIDKVSCLVKIAMDHDISPTVQWIDNNWL